MPKADGNPYNKSYAVKLGKFLVVILACSHNTDSIIVKVAKVSKY